MRRTTVIISMMLVLAILSVSIPPVLAKESATALDENKPVAAESKISESLKEKMEETDENERIPVWIWFTDIDFEAAEKEIAKITGFSEEEFILSKTLPKNNELLKAFESVSVSNQSNTDDSVLTQRIRDVFQISEKNNLELDKRINSYESIKQSVYKQYYNAHNTRILSEIGVQEEDVLYNCSISPSAIIRRSISDIYKIAHSNCVMKMYYYNESECVIEPDIENTRTDNHLYDQSSLHFSNTGFTGSSTNILVIGGNGYAGTYNTNNIQEYNLDTVYNVINHNSYSLSNTAALPNNISDHAQYVVTVLKTYAPNSNVYVVTPRDYDNILWAIDEYHIDLMCIAVGYSPQTDYYNAFSKWFDVISERKSIPVIASAGNDSSLGTCFPYVFAPANGYNTIATGAFTAKEDMMKEKLKNYRYNPAFDLNNPKFKPDVVCPTSDTSSAAPTLTGILACAIQANHELRHEPEIIKAIVMASCHRKVLPCDGLGDLQETMPDGLTSKQGAGTVDAYRILQISLEGTYGYGNLTENNITYEDNLLSEILNLSGTLKCDDDLNVSLAWMVKGTGENSPNNPNGNNSFNTMQELFLEVLDLNSSISNSMVNNSCKQMAYAVNKSANYTYRIRVTNDTPLINRMSVKFGYAWCQKGNKELSSVEVTYNASGDSLGEPVLEAEVYDSTGSVDPLNNYNYHWYSSDDGINWYEESCDGDKYYLTESDLNKYIKCIITPLSCSLYTSSSVEWISTNKVVLYGDVDLDNTISIFDANLISRYLAGLHNLTSLQLAVADVDLDGVVSINDSLTIQRYLAELIPSLPYSG